jgi:alkaline phosphatase D
MIFEDEKQPEDQRLGFVLHLGDFVYEVVWYPEDRKQGMYDRRLRDVVRYANGQKVGDFHVPTTLDDYRAVYRGYLRDPDLQDARARWPFVVMWDNHEFSWRGIQSIVRLGNEKIWGQTRKVAANQAWFEFQPARVKHAGNLDRFGAPKVADVPVTAFDEHGLGTEPNNLAAVNSLIAYRALRFGKHMDLVLTDHHSFRSDDPGEDPAAADLGERDFPYMVPEELTQALDYGRTDPGGPPAKLAFGPTIDNFRKDAPPVTILGATQKAWLKKTLAGSTATWKVWGCTNGALDVRTDPQNLPPGLVKPWPGAGYANSGGGDFSGAFAERDELYDFVRDRGVEGFAIVSGDRHSFWAGLAAKALPPKAFEPVGVAFITGSISAPGFAEGSEYNLKKTVPLRPLFLRDGPPAAKPEPVVNVLYRHGVRSALEYNRTGDMAAARKLSNPDLAPHLSFVDMAGHGYAKVTVDARAMETEFVCMPRPLERSATPDGGPLVYRVTHRAPLWRKGQRPRLEQRVLEGDPKLSI